MLDFRRWRNRHLPSIVLLLEVNFGWLLGCVRMLIASINVQIGVQLAPQAILGQHAFHGHFEDPLRVLCQQNPGRGEALSTGVTRMAHIDLIGQFLTSQTHFFSVDDDYVVATVNVWREVGLVFAANHEGNFTGQPTKYLSLCVNHNPVLLYRITVGRDGFITERIHFLY